MAVVQISRIQIRRGQKNSGTGLPQLASGELAWAIDTQELYIGNGAVSEGAPAVGNTKILTSSDNILDIAGTYVYKLDNGLIQTGSDVNYPVERSLQERLDERVSSAAYGIVADGTDQAVALQRLIDNLYITNTINGSSDRITVEFLPGTYSFSSTIFIPSYVTLIGAGRQKTIFNFTGNSGTAFRFINDTSTITSRSTLASTTYNNQPKFCRLQGFTLNLNEPDVEAFRLDAVRDSVFEDVEIIGTFGDSAGDSTVIGGGNGYSLNAFSSVVTCQRNRFINCRMERLEYCVYSQTDIINNLWDNCELIESRYGIDFGTGADLTSTGQQYGPRRNKINNCYLDDIERYGIRVSNGYGNKTRGNTFINVGNDGGGNTTGAYPQIYFVSKGNSSVQDTFDRQLDLATSNFGEDYLNEVQGKAFFANVESNQYNLIQSTPTLSNGFRLPFNGETRFKVDYVLKSTVHTQMRSGVISIAVDDTHNTVQLVDEYEYTGTAGEDLRIHFEASISNNCVLIQYENENIGDLSYMTYTYSALS